MGKLSINGKGNRPHQMTRNTFKIEFRCLKILFKTFQQWFSVGCNGKLNKILF